MNFHKFGDSGTTSEPSDEDYAAMMAQGDEKGLEAIVYKHGKFLRSIIAKHVSDDGHQEDVLQETWVQVYRRIASYDPTKGRFLGWLISVARRRAIDFIRRSQNYYHAIQRFQVESESVDGGELFFDRSVDENEMALFLQKALPKLPPLQADMLRLVFAGHTQRKIAVDEKIPLGTVKTRIELGLKKLVSLRKQEVFSVY